MLTEQQVNYFDVFGYLILRGAFASEIDEISKAFDEIIEDPNQLRMDSDSTPYVRGRREVVPAVVDLHPALMKLRDDPRITGIAESLLPGELRFLKGDGSRFHTESTTWHVDGYSNPKRKSPHIKMALYLESLDGDSGALRVIPGSHNDNDKFAQSLREMITHEDRPPSDTIGINGEDVPCTALDSNPGDLIVWNRRIAHASFRSKGPRRVITFGFLGLEPGTVPAKHQ